MNRNDAFLARNPWINQHPHKDANGNHVSPRFMLMKLLYQRNLLRRGDFQEAKAFGKEEGLHETTAYRLMGDVEVPQSIINDRLEEERRLQIAPTNNRGSYWFVKRPDEKPIMLYDPQTIHKIYWKDKCFDLLGDKNADRAAEEARKRHLSFDIICHFNRHRIYHKAINELNYSMAKMINERENLGFDTASDIREAAKQAFMTFVKLEQFSPVKAQKFAEAHNFIVFDLGTRRVVRLTKSTSFDTIRDQFAIPTLFNIAG